MTIAVRYGAQRQQFGPAEGQEVSVLDYSSQQLKLMPMLATAYALHFTAAFLVNQYSEAKRTKEEELIADVHSLSAGELPPQDVGHRAAQLNITKCGKFSFGGRQDACLRPYAVTMSV